jgi:hypothetical protein
MPLKASKKKSSKKSQGIPDETMSSGVQPAKTKAKKAVKKVISSEVRRVPSAFDDDLFVESSQKGSFFWPLLRFNFHEHCPSGSENEFVDIDSLSDAAPEVQKEVISAAVADTIVPQPVRPQDEASPEFTKELELTIHRGEILSKALPWSKFMKISPKAMLPLLPWLPLTRALVRPTAVNC